MPQEVRLEKGPANTMPATSIAGTISIQTDLGNVYLATSDTERVQLTDTSKMEIFGELSEDKTTINSTQTKSWKYDNGSQYGEITFIPELGSSVTDNTRFLQIQAGMDGYYAGSLVIEGPSEPDKSVFAKLSALDGVQLSLTQGNQNSVLLNEAAFTFSQSTLISNISDPVNDTDAVNKRYLSTFLMGNYLPLSGGTMTGDIDMQSNSIKFKGPDSSEDNDCEICAVTSATASVLRLMSQGYVDLTAQSKVTIQATRIELGQIDSITTPIIISGVATPVNPNDAATKEYVDNAMSSGINAGTLPLGTCSDAADATTKTINIAGSSGEINSYVQVLFTNGYTSGTEFVINGNTYSLSSSTPIQLYEAGPYAVGLFQFTGSSAYFAGFINYTNPLDISIDDGSLS